MGIEKNENQDLNQEAFKKDFWEQLTNLSPDEQNQANQLWANFDSNTKDLKWAFDKTVDNMVNKNLSNLWEEDKNKLKSLKEWMLTNPNDLKEMLFVMKEMNSIIWTDNKESAIQWENFNKNQEQAQKEKTKLQEFKDEFSKMLTKSQDLVKQNQEKAKQANLEWAKKQEEDWNKAESDLDSWWPETINEKAS